MEHNASAPLSISSLSPGSWGPSSPLSKALLVWELTCANWMWKPRKSSKPVWQLPSGLHTHLAKVNDLANVSSSQELVWAPLQPRSFSTVLSSICLPSSSPREAHLYLHPFFPSQPPSLPSFSLRAGTESHRGGLELLPFPVLLTPWLRYFPRLLFSDSFICSLLF